MTRERVYEIVRFGIVGVAATAIHYAVYYALLGLSGHNVAYTIGYVVSFACNYVLSSLFTFRVKMSTGKLMGFGMSHLINYLIQVVLLNLFVWLGVSPVWAPFPVFAIAVPVNYLLVRTALVEELRGLKSKNLP
ncbi:MAG: GtrA family protein [Prevotella sp.]|nr:GtrA family protein [Prevotella sp.]